MLPWSEMDSLQHETGKIQQRLVALNRSGLLTVNSQPAVNGAPSADPHVGWGASNGCAAPQVPFAALQRGRFPGSSQSVARALRPQAYWQI